MEPVWLRFIIVHVCVTPCMPAEPAGVIGDDLGAPVSEGVPTGTDTFRFNS